MKIFEFVISRDMGVLSFNGELDRQREGVVKEALMVSLANAHHVLVNLGKVTRIDDHCLQILDAAKEKARAMNKRIAFCGLKTEE